MNFLQRILPGEFISAVLITLYFAVLGLLSIYGLHRYQMLYLYYRHRARLRRRAVWNRPWPSVTVQLPLYNELYVARRLIEAVCAMDYPRELLEVQVLDDSTDKTSDLVAELVRLRREAGVRISHIRRAERRGYKAGALDAGLKCATGEFIAVFDADFVPPRDFLRRLLPHLADPAVGMVQARWDHLNRDYSLLTRVQSLLLDGHFVIEHAARNASGRFFNFNGTAGIWRRRCIEESGGWQHDTLTEDLDLSYRAQLAGWRFIYLADASAPSELPIEMDAFKSQQHRWAKGSVQTARKLLGRILRSPVGAAVKLEAFVHLTSNFSYPLMVMMSALLFPVMAIRARASALNLLLIDLPLFLISTTSVSSFYLCSQKELGRSPWKTLPLIPPLMAIGIGLSITTARAVLEALGQMNGEFRRTPKHGIEGREGSAAGKRYRGQRSYALVVEALFAVYFSIVLAVAVVSRMWAALPFLALFWWGYSFTAGLSLLQRLGPRTAASAGDILPARA